MLAWQFNKEGPEPGVISMVFIILLAILVKTRPKDTYIRVLSTGGEGGGLGEHPFQKFFLKKKLKAISNTDLI